MDLQTLLLFVVGIVLLLFGAEWLVRGASRVAAASGITPLVIGLTVVAFGTSAPELAVSVRSALGGTPDIALGNVVGSNIFNVLVILGVSSMVAPLPVSQQLVRLDAPLLVVVSILVYVLALDGQIGRIEGLLLFLGLIAYIVFTVVNSRRSRIPVIHEYADEFSETGPPGAKGVAINVGLIVVGLVLLVIGAQLLVDAAVVMARYLGISELVIGLTIVSGGTSLPEVAASVVATMRGQRDIAVGNAIGSSLFNLLGVLGLTSAVSATGIGVDQSALDFDMLVMVAAAVACLPIFFNGYRIDRWEGFLFMGYYIAYVYYVYLRATGSTAIEPFSHAMLWFVIPISTITVLVLMSRFQIKSRSSRSG